MDLPLTSFDLQVRFQIYRSFAGDGLAPSCRQVAETLTAAEVDVRRAFHRLHDHHMIFLEPGADRIRMANPFSALPTRFKVTAGEKQWWANCAWDSLGIAAALDLDVHISAAYPDSRELVEFDTRGGAVDGMSHVVHFPLPCRQWYDDLVFT